MKFLKTLLIFVDNNFTDLNSVLLLLSHQILVVVTDKWTHNLKQEMNLYSFWVNVLYFTNEASFREKR